MNQIRKGVNEALRPPGGACNFTSPENSRAISAIGPASAPVGKSMRRDDDESSQPADDRLQRHDGKIARRKGAAQITARHGDPYRLTESAAGRQYPVDFRLIVAINRNLEEMVRQGAFRDDLYDRLNMFSIWVPPLRARLEDIPLLVDYFMSDCVGQAKRLVTGAAQQVLDLFQKYSWPGNIRELRNVVKRGCLHRQN